jgi:hypothetical protein
MQMNPRRERANEYIIVLLPSFHSLMTAFSNQTIPFDAATRGIVVSDYDSPKNMLIANPYHVLGDKPMGIMSMIEITKVGAW